MTFLAIVGFGALTVASWRKIRAGVFKVHCNCSGRLLK